MFMKPWVKYVFIFSISFVVGIISFVGYTHFFNNVYGDGVEIELVGESETENAVSRFSVTEGGYYEGSITELVEADYDGPSPYEAYLVLDASLYGVGDEAVEFGGVSVLDKEGTLVGKSFAVHTNDDNLTNYVTDKELVEKYRLMGTGDKLYPNLGSEGAVYVETKKLKVGETYELVIAGADKGIEFKVGTDRFSESTLLDDKDVKDEIERGLKVGLLSKGVSAGVGSSGEMKDGIKIDLLEGVFYNKVAEDFHYNIGHLTSFNGTEKVLMVKVLFKNDTDKDMVMGKFVVERPNGDAIDAIRVVASEEVGNGRLDVATMKEYGLLSYHGVTNGETLFKKGQVIEGNVLFHSSEFVAGERLKFKYVGVDGKAVEDMEVVIYK